MARKRTPKDRVIQRKCTKCGYDREKIVGKNMTHYTISRVYCPNCDNDSKVEQKVEAYHRTRYLSPEQQEKKLAEYL